MKQVISTERIPLKLWLDDIEDGALEQAKNLANLPFAFHHIAIMPDSHQGYGMPIGAVLATQNVVIPNAVGVDIGCGMCAVKTSLTELDTERRKKIMAIIRKTVPIGFAHHQREQNIDLEEEISDDVRGNVTETVYSQLKEGSKQVGTLGGGNHFIELQQGDDGHIWIMIHSGSRNVGFRTANHYNELASVFNERYFSSVTKDKDLAFFPLDDKAGEDYKNDQEACVLFAYLNRRLMLDRIQEAVVEVYKDVCFDKEINLPHNYVTIENHFGKNVMVHRKGATSAREGEIGIIPGSQGSSSYIVKGKGNRDSFTSCSHGAGRRMGRKVAQNTLSLEYEKKRLDDMGVIHAVRNISDLDEAPGAYKDIETVMRNQSDLVDIIVKLKPLAVIKSSDGRVD